MRWSLPTAVASVTALLTAGLATAGVAGVVLAVGQPAFAGPTYTPKPSRDGHPPPAAPPKAGVSPPAATALPGPAESASARLQQLIAAHDLDEAGTLALARTAPALAWQRLDPRSRAALDYVLAMPAASIRNVREGQAVIRDSGEWSDDEWSTLSEVASALGVNPRRVQQVHVHTVDAQVVRVDLVLRGETRGVALAWPPEWTPPAVAADLRARGVEMPWGVVPPLQDGSFENPQSIGLSWVVRAPPGARVFRDTARVQEGTTSLRIEATRGGRGGPTVTQVLDARPGDRLLLTAAVAPDGGVATIGFFDGAREAAVQTFSEEGWQRATVTWTVPDGVDDLAVVLSAKGGGGVNVDDVRLVIEGPTPLAPSAWSKARSGTVTVHADPTRIADLEAAAARMDAALRAGLGRLSVPAEGAVDVWLYADAGQKAAVAHGAGAPTDPADDLAAGRCTVNADDAYAATCPIQVMLGRAWGAPANAVLGLGLPRALASSGADLNAVTRPTLATVPALPTLDNIGGPSRVAAVASFASWLLDTQSLAAARAAWQVSDLGTYTVAGKDMAALEADWRAQVGR